MRQAGVQASSWTCSAHTYRSPTWMAAYVPSPVYAGGQLFLVTDEGKPSRGVCFEAKTGRLLWTQAHHERHFRTRGDSSAGSRVLARDGVGRIGCVVCGGGN